MSAQNLTCLATTQADPYPTRLQQHPEKPWHERREQTVKGRHLPGPLTEHQLDHFEKNGFLFEPGFLPADEVATLTEAMNDLLNRDDYRDKPFTITEPGSQKIRSVFAVHFLHRAFQHLARDPRLTQRVEQILGGGHYVHQSRINYKPGFKGKGFNWHSDFETWHAEDGMPEMHAVSASIILTDNHLFNGPLMLIPGSHKHFIPCVGPTPEEHHKESLKTQDRKSTRLNSSHDQISYAVFCLKKKIKYHETNLPNDKIRINTNKSERAQATIPHTTTPHTPSTH